MREGSSRKGAERAGVWAELAPKNEATLQELRAHRRQEQVQPIILQGSAISFVSGPGGCTNKMLKVCLNNTEALHLLTSIAEDFARSSASSRGSRWPR